MMGSSLCAKVSTTHPSKPEPEPSAVCAAGDTVQILGRPTLMDVPFFPDATPAMQWFDVKLHGQSLHYVLPGANVSGLIPANVLRGYEHLDGEGEGAAQPRGPGPGSGPELEQEEQDPEPEPGPEPGPEAEPEREPELEPEPESEPEQATTKLAPTRSLAQHEYEGQECREMWHGTSSAAGMEIVRAQRFKPSAKGLLGPGIYLSRNRRKAEHYRRKAGDDGVMLRCRARMGACKTLVKRDPLMKTWHDEIDPKLGYHYNSAFAPEGVTKIRGQPSREEHCIFNPDRIDRIEIFDGPGAGAGPEFWPSEPVAVGDGPAWFWFGDSAAGRQTVAIPYGLREARALEQAYNTGQPSVRVNATYQVDLRAMMQRRIGGPLRQRRVERREADAQPEAAVGG